MLWLTWRQFRTQAVVAAAALAVVAILLVTTGLDLAHQYDMAGLTGCHQAGDCAALASSFLSRLRFTGPFAVVISIGSFVTLLAPALIGVFWGAPMVAREIEPGTFRLAWSQSVSRNRWIAVKLTVVGLASMVASGMLGLLMTWWVWPVYHAIALAGGRSPININRFTPGLFGGSGIVPIGYAAFAFALGVAAGMLIRRTVPAMAATLASVAIIEIGWSALVRPHLIGPVHVVMAISAVSLTAIGQTHGSLLLAAGGKAGAWILTSSPVDTAGHLVKQVPRACLSAFNSAPNAFPGCLARNGVKVAVSYQPGDRYWDFQWLETGAFLVLALTLASFCYWWIGRRRLT